MIGIIVPVRQIYIINKFKVYSLLTVFACSAVSEPRQQAEKRSLRDLPRLSESVLVNF